MDLVDSLPSAVVPSNDSREERTVLRLRREDVESFRGDDGVRALNEEDVSPLSRVGVALGDGRAKLRLRRDVSLMGDDEGVMEDTW